MTMFLPIRGVTDSTTVFARYDYEGIVANVFGINSPALWNRASLLFEEYAVKGFSLEWTPTNIVSDGTGPVLSSGYVYQDLNTYNIAGYNDDQASMSNGFQLINPAKSFAIRLDGKALASSQHVKWPKTSASGSLSNGLP